MQAMLNKTCNVIWIILLIRYLNQLSLFYFLYVDKQEKKVEKEKAVAKESERMVSKHRGHNVTPVYSCSPLY